MIGETLDGKYRLVRLLGEGGMGAVYEARHTETNRRVAIKIIRDDRRDKADRAEERVRRFQREARAAGAIDTQHIAQVLDAGTDAARGVPYIALEYLNGEDLHQLLKRVGVLSPEVALRVVGQACIGLLKAHEARVYHRDIKPANIFLAEREEGEIKVKLLDFGIAKVRKEEEAPYEDTTGLTRTGALIGSPLYMSPEQARSLPGLDGRSDLWSLGVVLYRALAGRAPHEGITTVGGLIYSICAEPAAPIRDLAPWLSPAIAGVVHRALEIKREARFQTAAEMLAAIKALVPDGLSLRREDLVAFASAERAQMVSLAEAATETAATETASAEGAQVAVVTEASTEMASVRVPQAGDPSAPTAALTDSGARPAKAKRGPLLLGAALALGLGALGVYRLVAPPSPAPQSASAGVEASSPVVESATPAASASARPAVERSNLRQVRLEVAPRDVSVEVDGTLVSAVDASVEIKGELGSAHKVRLFKEGREQTAEVVISEEGPRPPKVDLGAAPGGGKGPAHGAAGPARSSAAPARSAQRAPASTAPAAPTSATRPVDPLLPENF